MLQFYCPKLGIHVIYECELYTNNYDNYKLNTSKFKNHAKQKRLTFYKILVRKYLFLIYKHNEKFWLIGLAG